MVRRVIKSWKNYGTDKRYENKNEVIYYAHYY